MTKFSLMPDDGRASRGLSCAPAKPARHHWVALSVAAALSLPIAAQAAKESTKKDAASAGAVRQAAPCQAGESSFFRDEGLTMKVQAKLQFNRQLMREQIHVKVNGGVASLSGGLSTPQHIAMAVDVARQVEGIHCVNNFLRVGPPDPPTQGPIN